MIGIIMNLDKYLNMEDIKDLIDITEGGEDNDMWFHGKLEDSGHHFRLQLRKDPEGNYFEINIANRRTFDRWANSSDVSTEVPDNWEKDLIMKKIRDMIKLAEIYFNAIPDIYWNKWLRLKF